MVKTGRANDVFTPKGLYIEARGSHPGVPNDYGGLVLMFTTCEV